MRWNIIKWEILPRGAAAVAAAATTSIAAVAAAVGFEKAGRKKISLYAS